MMNDTDLLKAIRLMNAGSYSFVLCKDNCTLVSKERGIKTLLHWVKNGLNIKDFFAADRIVGQASAYLYVLLGVRAVYSPIMSEAAIYTLARFGIHPYCDQSVSVIDRETDSYISAIDEAVNGIKDAQSALTVIESSAALIG